MFIWRQLLPRFFSVLLQILAQCRCLLGQDSGHLARASGNLEELQLAGEMVLVLERRVSRKTEMPHKC